jgi:tetratricopeptide (TPR) repeat protein
MRELPYPEKHHLNAALGWLDLGSPVEAKAEADRISWVNRFHPQVFVVRWRIHSHLGNWEAARDLARIFTSLAPDRADGWLCLSYSLYKLNRPLEAFLQLLHRAEAFPRVSAVPYFLACFAWELGDHKGAGKWLAKSKALGGAKILKSAFADHTELFLDGEQVTSKPPAVR